MRHKVPVLKLNDGTLVVEADHFHDVPDAIPVKESRGRDCVSSDEFEFFHFDLLFDKRPVAQNGHKQIKTNYNFNEFSDEDGCVNGSNLTWKCICSAMLVEANQQLHTLEPATPTNPAGNALFTVVLCEYRKRT